MELVAVYCTLTAIGADGMPLATTSTVLAPSSWFAGTSKLVDTIPPKATRMPLWSCVRL